MKKSTLITTIAMIVVVVVALSTATYAWFSTTTTAVAGATFSTEASGDWSMIQGAIGATTSAGGAAVTFQTAPTTNINLADFALANDLWAPTDEISTKIDGYTAATTISSLASYVNAKIDGTDAVIKKAMTATHKYTKNGNTWTSATVGNNEYGQAQPIALRVINVSGATKELMLGITVNAGSDASKTTTMYAGAAIRFYVAVTTKNGSNAATSTFTSGYNVSTLPGPITLNETKCTQGTAIEAEGFDEDDLMDYTAGDILQEYTLCQVGQANTLLGIEEGNYYTTYTLDLGQFAAAGYANILIYPWVDGWLADTSAASANFTVKFGFYSPNSNTSGSEASGND